MTTNEIITIAALVIGPILAVQVEKLIARNRENRGRKLAIFKTLMATRGSILSYQHVEALNRIDLEFQGDKYVKVIRSWKEYFDELCQDRTPEKALELLEKRTDLLANLLLEMGLSLGYDFDRVLVKRNVYSPKGHAKIEDQNEFIRDGMIKLIEGKLSIPISIEAIEVDDENRKAQEKQALMQELIIEYYQVENKKRASQVEEAKATPASLG